MSHKDKLLARLLELPSDMTFKEIELILKWNGYTRKRKKTGSSHVIFQKSEHFPIHFPFTNKPVKKCYLEEIIEILELEK